MTDVLSPAEAGWYPDPSGGADRRFWDGRGWTEHVRGDAEHHPPAPAPSVGVRVAAPPSGDGPATAALVLGLVALVADVLLVPSVLGIVFGVRALRAGTNRSGQATAGIVLAALGVLVAALQASVLAAIAVPIVLGAQHAAVVDRVENTVQTQAEAQGVPVDVVNCILPVAIHAGTTMRCTLTTTSRREQDLMVRFTDDRGDFTWQTVG